MCDTPLSLTSRREFVAAVGSCAAHLALASSVVPFAVRQAWAATSDNTVVAREPWGRLEQVAEGVWAMISAPLNGDRTTLSNGGIIAGRNYVMAIEGFFTPQGAHWLSVQAKKLTGRFPTYVVLTHHHADHVNGVEGYLADGNPTIVFGTDAMRAQALTKGTPLSSGLVQAMQVLSVLDTNTPTTIDLGGRRVNLVPRAGHTSSDVTVELQDPSIVFGGDLIWNAMIPNFVDAIPTVLTRQVKSLRRERSTVYVPGHGAVADAAAMDRYLAVLGELEVAARAAYVKGTPAAVAGAAFTLSPALGEWTLFGATFYERAFAAWNRELSQAR
jgi:glyoxylase-like metal-dependent hydrolase (beta-lactamase superfamily II)